MAVGRKKKVGLPVIVGVSPLTSPAAAARPRNSRAQRRTRAGATQKLPGLAAAPPAHTGRVTGKGGGPPVTYFQN